MKKGLAANIALLFISPIMVLVNGLYAKNRAYKQWLLVLFVTMFGSVIVLSTSDGAVHLSKVYDHYLDLSFSQFWSELIKILKFEGAEGTKGDVYLHLISYFTGSILGAPGLFFVVVSFIYGYFYVRGMLMIFAENMRKHVILFTIFGLCFVLWKGLEGINTVRTWTGAWVLFVGTVSYFRTRKLKYLVLMACAPLIHIAYFVMALPAYLVVVLGARPSIYAVIFAVSFFTTIDIGFVTKNLSSTEIGENKVAGYYDEGVTRSYSLEGRDKGNFYVRLGKRGTNFWAINILAALLILQGVYHKGMYRWEQKVLSVGILMIALANFMNFIPALFNRTMINGGLYILAMVLVTLGSGRLIYGPGIKMLFTKMALYVSVLLFVPFILFQASNLLQFNSLFIVAMPFLPWLSEDINMSIRDFLVWLV